MTTARDTPTAPSTPAAPGAELEPYGQLLKMLLPRARQVAIHGAPGRQLWATSAAPDPAVSSIARQALAAPAGTPFGIDGFVRSLDDALYYAFRLREASGRPLAVVTLVVPQTADPRPFALVLSVVRPALDCLARELAMRLSIGALARDLSTRDGDLDLLLGVAGSQDGSVRDADELGQLVEAAATHLRCYAGALLVPERSITIVRRGAAASTNADLDLVTRSHRHLLAAAQADGRTLIVNAEQPGRRLPPGKILSMPVRHASGRVMGVLALYRRATDADFERRHARLGELLARKVGLILQTSFDAATGLPTRAALEAEAAVVLAGGAGPHSVIYIDLDQMHVINEDFSMPIGDEVIFRVAETLRRRVPREARVARVGGDRFAVLLPARGLEDAVVLADDLRRAVRELTGDEGRSTLSISLSAGVAALATDTKQPLAHALAAAEVACKAAKDRGRDRVERYQPNDEHIVRRHNDVHLVAGLRESLARNQFQLYAQPMRPLAVLGSDPSYEILLRRQTQAGTMLPPSKFLSAAERHQLMPQIDAWVIEHTFRALAAHAALLNQRGLRFSINLSAQSLGNDSLIATIDGACVAARLRPELICFELTETAAATDIARTAAVLQDLSAMGFQFALDDFGTGQCSLAHVRSLPVTVLKVDGSFVRDALADERAADLVKAIAQMARTLGMETVAEFVETDASRAQMTDLGVDYGQGFAIGRPAPLGDVLAGLDAD